MSEKIGVTLDEYQVDGLDEMKEQGRADSYSEAGRIAIATGLEELGHTNGSTVKTPLRATTHELAKLFLWAGFVLMGITFFYPIELRILVVGPITSGLFLLGVNRLLANIEPRVSNKLRSLIGGETA